MGQPSGFRWARARWQWQSTLTAHDPNPPITLEDGGAPPVIPSIIESWWTVWDDAEHDNEGDGWWLAAIYEEASAPAVIDPVFGRFEADDEDEAEALDFGATFAPPLNNFIAAPLELADDDDAEPVDTGFPPVPGLNDFVQGALDAHDEDDDEAPQVVAWIDPPAAPVVIDPVMGWAEALDEEDEEDPWASAFPHGAERGPDPISGFFEAVEEEAEDTIEAVIASVIAANDFVQGLFQGDVEDESDDGLAADFWSQVPPAGDPGGSGAAIGIGQGEPPTDGIGRWRVPIVPDRLGVTYDGVHDPLIVHDESLFVPTSREPSPPPASTRPTEERRESTALTQALLSAARDEARAAAEVAAELARQKARDRTLAIIIAIAEADDD